MKSTRVAADSDRDLIRRCLAGSVGAWQRLLDNYEGLVYSIPLRYGLSRDDAADVAQITFTILIQSLHTLSEDSRLGPWLATVARRHTWRFLERNRRETASERLEDTRLAQSAVLLGKHDADSIEHWELTEWLDTGLSKISESCRELLLALYFQPEQPSYAEIVDRLGMPLGSIGPTRARCLKRLKQVLGEG
ncbi:MAG: sigma-70 family RNA polymerase sigma factor [Rubrobacter sp.]|nr:sigma-70 family RNA polymerase sigma factor [Rubrobacter sp.]